MHTTGLAYSVSAVALMSYSRFCWCKIVSWVSLGIKLYFTLTSTGPGYSKIKGVSDDVTFGCVSILAVGDLYQLPPVVQTPLFSTVGDCHAELYRLGSLWIGEFQLVELDKNILIMRQRDDPTFAELLCRVRTDNYTAEDFDTLKSRVITVDSPNYPTHVLHVYTLNDYANDRNRLLLNSLAPQCE